MSSLLCRREIFYFSIILCLVFPLTSLFGQGLKLDSLKGIYLKQKDTVKLETLRRIVREHIINNDSAIKYSELGIAESRRQHHLNYEGKFLMYNSTAYHNSGNYSKALESGKASLNNFEQNSNYVWAAGMCNTIAKVFIDMLEYDSALFYQLKGLEFHDHIDLNPGTFEAMSLMAYIYELIQDTDKAIEWNQKMMKLARDNGYEYYEAESYFNLGNVFDLKEDFDSAIYYKHKALKSTSEVKSNNYIDLIGNIGNSFILKGTQDSALYYTKIFYDSAWFGKIDYYRREQKKARSAINLGMIYTQLDKPELAKNYLLQGVEEATNVDFGKELIEAYRGLFLLYQKEGDFEKALEFHERYTDLKNQAINDENLRNLQNLSIKYDTDKKGQEISLLKLQNQLKDRDIKRAELQSIASAIGILTLVLFGFLYFNRMKYRQRALISEEREKNQKDRFSVVIDAEEKERKRIARELHDGLGQLLSATRLNVSAMEDTIGGEQRRQLQNSLKLIDEAVSEVRNISHNMMPNALTSLGLIPALKEKIHQINGSGKIKVSMNIPSSLPELPELTRISLYRVIQELINNSIKFADASLISIHIENLIKKGLQIIISDDGNGFDPTLIHTADGIGWQNIYARIELINGSINISSNKGQGTKTVLTIPND